MEDRVRRESSSIMERLFKEKDEKGIGAIKAKNMPTILRELVPVYDEGELDEMINELKKDSSYVTVNKVTNKFEVNKEKDMLDFPSATAIAVHFLTKHERKASRATGFSGRGLIKLDDFSSFDNSAGSPLNQKAKRMY